MSVHSDQCCRLYPIITNGPGSAYADGLGGNQTSGPAAAAAAAAAFKTQASQATTRGVLIKVTWIPGDSAARTSHLAVLRPLTCLAGSDVTRSGHGGIAADQGHVVCSNHLRPATARDSDRRVMPVPL